MWAPSLLSFLPRPLSVKLHLCLSLCSSLSAWALPDKSAGGNRVSRGCCRTVTATNVKTAETCSDLLVRTMQAPAQPSDVLVHSVKGTRASVPAWSTGDFRWPFTLVVRPDIPCSSMLCIHKGKTSCKVLIFEEIKIYSVGSLRIKNWESFWFGRSYIFAACCFRATRSEKLACLPLAYCCNTHISVYIVQREERLIPLRSCS